MKFIAKKHHDIKEMGLKWWENQPKTGEEYFEYARYQYALKDFGNAAKWYLEAVEADYTPAYYEYAYCLRNGLAIEQNIEISRQLFSIFLVKMKKGENQKEDNEFWNNQYRQAMCFAYGYGTEKEEEKARNLFEESAAFCAESLYEIGMAYRDGRLGYPKDKEKAETYFRKAYDNYAEEAIFASYEMFEGTFEEYPYQLELIEAYSYRIGEYMRVVHVNPSVFAYQRLIELYENGFPGDTGEDDVRFKRKALKFIKKRDALLQNKSV